jgi:hypothetical protein
MITVYNFVSVIEINKPAHANLDTQSWDWIYASQITWTMSPVKFKLTPPSSGHQHLKSPTFKG